MRLIDADELIKEFDPNGENLSPITVRLKIARQPTAYDVDKVVEQLETKQKELENISNNVVFDKKRKAQNHGYFVVMNHAIEIVEGGGVNESDKKKC